MSVFCCFLTHHKINESGYVRAVSSNERVSSLLLPCPMHITKVTKVMNILTITHSENRGVLLFIFYLILKVDNFTLYYFCSAYFIRNITNFNIQGL